MNEIHKMFYQDASSKKRIGSNVHKRTGKGSATAGVKGGVRLSTTKFKKHEKNSKVENIHNMVDVVPFDEFQKYDNSKQKILLEIWLKRHTKTHVCEEMGISLYKLRKLVSKYDIDVQKEYNKKDSDPQMNDTVREMMARNDIISKNELLKLEPADRYRISEYYMKERRETSTSLAEKWGFKDAKSLSSTKSMWKSAYKKKYEGSTHEESKNQTSRGSIQKMENNSDYDSLLGMDNQPEIRKDKGGNEPKSRDYHLIHIDSRMTGIEVKEKLMGVNSLLSNQHEYELIVKVKEVE